MTIGVAFNAGATIAILALICFGISVYSDHRDDIRREERERIKEERRRAKAEKKSKLA